MDSAINQEGHASVKVEAPLHAIEEVPTWVGDAVGAGKEQTVTKSATSTSRQKSTSSGGANSETSDNEVHNTEARINENDDSDEDYVDKENDQDFADDLEDENDGDDMDEEEEATRMNQGKNKPAQTVIKSRLSTSSTAPDQSARISPDLTPEDIPNLVHRGQNPGNLQGLFDTWNLKSLKDTFQQHPEITPVLFRLPFIEMLYQVAQVISQETAEMHMHMLVQAEPYRKNAKSSPSIRVQGYHLEALLVFLKGKLKVTRKINGRDNQVERVNRLAKLLRRVAAEKPNQLRLEPSNTTEANGTLEVAEDVVSAPKDRVDFSMPSSHARSIPAAPTTHSRSLHPPEQPPAAFTPPTPDEDPIVEFGRIYPGLHEKNKAVEAAEAALKEGDDEWRRACNKRRIAEEQVADAKRQRADTQARVATLRESIPEGLAAGLVAFYEQRNVERRG